MKQMRDEGAPVKALSPKCIIVDNLKHKEEIKIALKSVLKKNDDQTIHKVLNVVEIDARLDHGVLDGSCDR